MLGYYEDGPNLVTLATNGFGEGEPAWWLNLKAHPEATVDLPGGKREVRARAATGDERDPLWARWHEMGDSDIDALAARKRPPAISPSGATGSRSRTRGNRSRARSSRSVIMSPASGRT